MPATYRTATRRPTLLTGAAWRRGPRYWGDVAVVDVKASAIKAWVAKMAADEVGAPTIEVRRPRWPTRWIAGLRWGEMAALRVCDFDMLRRRVNVSRSSPNPVGWCGVRRKPGSAGRFH